MGKMFLNAAYHFVLDAVITIEKIAPVRPRSRSRAGVDARSEAGASAWEAADVKLSSSREPGRALVVACRDCAKARGLFSSDESVGKGICAPIQFIFYHTLNIYMYSTHETLPAEEGNGM